MLVNDSADYSGEPMKVIPIPVKKNCSHSLLKGKGCQEFRFFSCEGAAPVQYLLTSYHCNSEEAWVLWSSKVKCSNVDCSSAPVVN